MSAPTATSAAPTGPTASRATSARGRWLCAAVGQDSDDHPLDQRVDHGADRESGEEREGSVAAGIFRFAHGRERGLESAVGEDQKQHGFQPLAGIGGRDGCGRNGPVMLLKYEQT